MPVNPDMLKIVSKLDHFSHNKADVAIVIVDVSQIYFGRGLCRHLFKCVNLNVVQVKLH
jgi:hypothetical protein